MRARSPVLPNVVVAVAALGAFLALASGPTGAETSAPAPETKPAPTLADVKVVQKLDKPDDLLARFPAVAVEPRKDKIDGFPCSECHDDSMVPDPKERVLTEAHDDIVLVHGGGRFWCTTCHGADKDKEKLVSLKGEAIDFDQQFLLCGQCHFKQQREFFYGAHGKRLDSWRGDHKVAACTSCHDAHDPSIKARKPWRGPDAVR